MEEITLKIAVDSDVLQKQLNHLKRLVEATSGNADRSEFHRGWCAAIEAVKACFTVPLEVRNGNNGNKRENNHVNQS
jgi:hypothetical protein